MVCVILRLWFHVSNMTESEQKLKSVRLIYDLANKLFPNVEFEITLSNKNNFEYCNIHDGKNCYAYFKRINK